MSGVVKNVYGFVNLGLAAFVLSAVAVRFVFPAVSAEGPAFWIMRKAPTSMRTFLWSKFWMGVVPVLVLAEVLTILSNHFLGVALPLKWIGAIAIFFMTFALVGLAAGMGARYPRFRAENLTQVAGSYGGISFMVIAVAFIVVEIVLLGWPTSLYLWYEYREIRIPPHRILPMAVSVLAALSLCIALFWISMRGGIEALERMEDT